MAEEINSWIAKLIDRHYLEFGTDLSKPHVGNRAVQILKWENYRDDKNTEDQTVLHAIASDRTHRVRLIFDFDETTRQQQKHRRPLTKHLRQIYYLNSFRFQIPETPAGSTEKPILELKVDRWKCSPGSETEPEFYPNALPLQISLDLDRNAVDHQAKIEGIRSSKEKLRQAIDYPQGKSTALVTLDALSALAIWWQALGPSLVMTQIPSSSIGSLGIPAGQPQHPPTYSFESASQETMKANSGITTMPSVETTFLHPSKRNPDPRIIELIEKDGQCHDTIKLDEIIRLQYKEKKNIDWIFVERSEAEVKQIKKQEQDRIDELNKAKVAKENEARAQEERARRDSRASSDTDDSDSDDSLEESVEGDARSPSPRPNSQTASPSSSPISDREVVSNKNPTKSRSPSPMSVLRAASPSPSPFSVREVASRKDRTNSRSRSQRPVSRTASPSYSPVPVRAVTSNKKPASRGHGSDNERSSPDEPKVNEFDDTELDMVLVSSSNAPARPHLEKTLIDLRTSEPVPIATSQEWAPSPPRKRARSRTQKAASALSAQAEKRMKPTVLRNASTLRNKSRPSVRGIQRDIPMQDDSDMEDQNESEEESTRTEYTEVDDMKEEVWDTTAGHEMETELSKAGSEERDIDSEDAIDCQLRRVSHDGPPNKKQKSEHVSHDARSTTAASPSLSIRSSTPRPPVLPIAAPVPAPTFDPQAIEIQDVQKQSEEHAECESCEEDIESEREMNEGIVREWKANEARKQEDKEQAFKERQEMRLQQAADTTKRMREYQQDRERARTQLESSRSTSAHNGSIQQANTDGPSHRVTQKSKAVLLRAQQLGWYNGVRDLTYGQHRQTE